jgi:hypothetical protein
VRVVLRPRSFLITEDAPGGACVYYEPHCDFTPASVAAALALAGRPVDVCITPCTAIAFAGYPLVRATPPEVLALLRLLRPAVLLPLRNDVLRESGAIAPAISARGSVAAVRAALAADDALRGAVTLMEAAPAGQTLAIELPQR